MFELQNQKPEVTSGLMNNNNNNNNDDDHHHKQS